ncbi:MAG: LamG domain-containing protein [Deltaproteobacteria bacterium]|nr:LamG domain-containing protein [Deltaproteobacteria bacterium]
MPIRFHFALGVIFALLLVASPGEATAAALSLRFHGHGVGGIDRVRIPIDAPARPIDVGGDFTLEWWMRAAPADNTSGACAPGSDNWITGNVLADRDVYFDGDHGDFGVSLHGGVIAFGAHNGTAGAGICGATTVADNAWHHVAVTRTAATGALTVWVDGALDASGAGPTGDLSYRDGRSTSFPNDPYLVLGAEKHDAGSNYPSYDGFLDELRVSTIVRYASAFTPPSTPFATDASTVGLFHFDEGPAGPCTGAVLDDSGAAGGPSSGACVYGGSAPAGPEYSAIVPFGAGPTPTPAPTPSCAAAPLAGCRTPAAPAKAFVQIRDRTPDDKDALAWKWMRGAVTTLADFGNPLAGTDYRLCLYDGGGRIAAAVIPGGGTCGTKPCWKATSTSFRYTTKSATPGGIESVTLKQGLVAGKAQILVRGRGTLLDTPAPDSIVSPLRVQLVNDLGTCWEATYSFPPALKLVPAELKDRAD